jgi:signal transduction histidine kinase/DNA-binding response OmpR family regulator/ligand-binding sensor domain-containing protein
MRAARSLVLMSSVALAAAPAMGQRAPGFRVDTWSSEDGLPSTAFTALVQAADGYLWMATGGNLVRFDGFEFRVFNAATHPVIRDRVNRLYVGIGDTLWIGLDDGTILSMAKGNFAELGRLPHRQHTGIVQDRNGTLLVVGFSQALRWTGTTFEPLQLPDGWQLVRGQPPARRDAAGDAWLKGLDGSLLRVRDGIGEPAGRSETNRVVMQPSRGSILRVRRSGSVGEVLDGAGRVLATYDWDPDILPILVDRNGRLWAGAAARVIVYEPGRTGPIAQVDLEDRAVFGGMLEDRAGNIWLANAGLVRIQEMAFSNVTRDPTLTGLGRQLRTLTRGPDGTVLAELNGPAVVQFAGGVVVPVDTGLAGAWADERGTMWIHRAGRLAGRRPGRPDLVMPRLARAGGLMIADDPSRPGTLWYAGDDRLYHADPYAEGGPRIIDSVVVGALPRNLAVDPRGMVWMATMDDERTQQLVRYAGGEVSRWSRRDGMPASEVRALHLDRDGSVWLGLYGGGLVRFVNEQFRALGAEQGLAENVVSCILDDNLGNLWLSGNRGVHRVRRDDAIAFFEGRVPRVHGVSYGRRDGIADPETSGSSCARDGAGRLWFPTFGGGAVVDPAHALALDSTPPVAHVLGIRTAGDTLLPASITRLPLGQRRLAFSYTAIGLRNPAALRFEYRLDGVDDEWIHAGASRIATYNDVGPGTHVFRVRAVNGGGTWSAADAALSFTVPPYFHETIPFYVLLTGMLAFGAHLLWRARTVQLHRRQAELRAMVEARTADLGRTLTVVENQASQLRSLDEAKSRFFANVSHEFRTPLSLIMGPLEDLRDGRSGALNDTARRKLGTILANSQRLSQLVEQLLDVARLESGTLTLRAEVRDVVPQLRRIAESFASLAERRGISFRVAVPAGGLRVRHDPDQLEKIVGNLSGNALKFTPPGGLVELRAAREGDWAVIEVEDTGPGIAAEHQERIFERFYQADDSSRRAHEGTGIGLALAKELVELHGGTLAVRSAEGEGSTFTVRLPLATGEATVRNQETVAPDDPVVSAPAMLEAAATAATAGSRDDVTTVLVAEDNEELLEYLAEHLRDQYRVITAANGARALALARERVPDLVVSDVMMPELDGQSLCEAIKADPEIDFIPVILLTAKASRESRLAGLEGGADDYLAKPVDMRELLVRAANLITSRRRLRERFQSERRALPTLPPPPSAAPLDAGSDAFIRKLYAAMAEHVGDEAFSVDSLAAAVDMSRSTLYRRLEALTGKSPMEVLWDYRLQQAAQWLRETDANVSEIAYGVGFKSVPHFCARFRERFGLSPSAYRRTP